MDSCPGCAEIGRMQADFAAQLPTDPIARQRAAAGIVFKVVPFDPRRDLPDMAGIIPADTGQPMPSLADPITEHGRILTPDDYG